MLDAALCGLTPEFADFFQFDSGKPSKNNINESLIGISRIEA